MISRFNLPLVTGAATVLLAGCDPPPRVEIVNGADAAVVVIDARRIRPGAIGRYTLPWDWISGKAQPSVEFKGCDYRYQLPRQDDYFGYPVLNHGIGQWSALQFERDGTIYARERHPAKAATLAELRPQQPKGWPIRPVYKTCR
jgi:hypothetical protein